MKPAYLMTLDEYKNEVSPLLKEYNKFLKKNTEFFTHKDYYGLECYNWNEYFEHEMSRLIKGGYKSITTEDYIVEMWQNKNQIKPALPKQATIELVGKYNTYILKFREIFSNISKIEKDETNSNKREIRRVLSTTPSKYLDLLKNDELSYEQLEQIFSPNGIKMPKNLEKLGFTKKNNFSPILMSLNISNLKAFVSEIKKEFEPILIELKNKKKTALEDYTKTFLESNMDILKFAAKNWLSPTQTMEVENYINIYSSDNNKFQKFLDEYADSFIENFICSVASKLGSMLKNDNDVKCEVLHFKFRKGRYEGCVMFIFSNGFKCFANVSLISAGGHNIQSFHYRYLVNLSPQGSGDVSLYKLIELYNNFKLD